MPKKKVKKKTAAAGESEPTFEESLGKLEAIVADLEGGELGLADSLEQYEQAVSHLKRCHAALEHAEGRIELLSGVDKQGNPIATPYDNPGDGSLESKSASRSKRRSAGKKASGVDDGNHLF